MAKTCSKCNQLKSFGDFYKNSSNKKDGLRPDCKSCRDAMSKIWYLNNIDKIAAYNFERHLKNRYNLSIDEFERLKLKFNSVCLICERKTQLHIDHCHKTGKVRGMLCPDCNKAIGLFKENIQTLNGAVEYLRSFN